MARLTPGMVAGLVPSPAHWVMDAVVPCATGIHPQMPDAGGCGGSSSWKKRQDGDCSSQHGWAWAYLVGNSLGKGMNERLCWCLCSSLGLWPHFTCVAPRWQ